MSSLTTITNTREQLKGNQSERNTTCFQDNMSEALCNKMSQESKEMDDERRNKSTQIQIPDIPLLCLMSAFQQKASIKKLSSWISMSLTLDGRDKITKVIQYSCRFLTWWYTNVSKQIRTANSYKSLYKSLVESRKAFRLGRTITEMNKLRSNPYVQQKILQPYNTNSSSSSTKQTTNSNNHISTKSQCDNQKNDERINDSIEFRHPCAALKGLGLAGFWFGDNLTYLTSIGFLDSFLLNNINSKQSQNQEQISKLRNRQKEKMQHFAARSYFVAAVIGLYANIREVILARKQLVSCHNHLRMIAADLNYFHSDHDATHNCTTISKQNGSVSSSPSLMSKKARTREDMALEWSKALQEWEMKKHKYFLRVVALVKSVCDTIVFSNNPGVDLHKKYRGRKMHEGLHCLLGILSASTVIYNNLPQKK